MWCYVNGHLGNYSRTELQDLDIDPDEGRDEPEPTEEAWDRLQDEIADQLLNHGMTRNEEGPE